MITLSGAGAHRFRSYDVMREKRTPQGLLSAYWGGRRARKDTRANAHRVAAAEYTHYHETPAVCSSDTWSRSKILHCRNIIRCARRPCFRKPGKPHHGTQTRYELATSPSISEPTTPQRTIPEARFLFTRLGSGHFSTAAAGRRVDVAARIYVLADQ